MHAALDCKRSLIGTGRTPPDRGSSTFASSGTIVRIDYNVSVKRQYPSVACLCLVLGVVLFAAQPGRNRVFRSIPLRDESTENRGFLEHFFRHVRSSRWRHFGRIAGKLRWTVALR